MVGILNGPRRESVARVSKGVPQHVDLRDFDGALALFPPELTEKKAV